MSVAAAPWEWDCPCGLRNNVEHAFCMGCGRPAVAGRIMATGAAVDYQPGPMTAPPTATFTAPFCVVDQRGRSVLTVDAGPEGARLSLCNAAGHPVVTISVVEGGGALIVSNKGGHAVGLHHHRRFCRRLRRRSAGDGATFQPLSPADRL